jgi:hypothetical protein
VVKQLGVTRVALSRVIKGHGAAIVAPSRGPWGLVRLNKAAKGLGIRAVFLNQETSAR